MKKRDEDYNISDIGNWNVAKEYSHFKIMKNLYLADEYSNIAIFGSASIIEELENQIPIDILKLSGLSRLINSLILIIDNSLFAAKKGNSKTELEGYREELRRILKVLPVSYQTKTIKGKSTIQIIPEKYSLILEKVLSLKSKINEPLNQNHLIFVDKEEFDPKEYKKNIFDGAINRG